MCNYSIPGTLTTVFQHVVAFVYERLLPTFINRPLLSPPTYSMSDAGKFDTSSDVGG